MLKGGTRGPAMVPGKPAESLLLRAVRQSETLKMPPSGKLKDAEIARIGRWIEMGAPWGAVRPRNPAKRRRRNTGPSFRRWRRQLPAVRNTAWVQSPIDRFVLAALEAKGLKPAPPADKRTLIRRATFDLTGLPPTPEEVRAFLDDTGPMRSRAWSTGCWRRRATASAGGGTGSMWRAMPIPTVSTKTWSTGNAWRYRDYVIQAFNKDKPYDLFVKEQLAGDLLARADSDARGFERWTATGFLSLGAKMLAEDDPVKMEMDIVDEQLDTTARTFMGLTRRLRPLPRSQVRSDSHRPTITRWPESSRAPRRMENFNVVANGTSMCWRPRPSARS